jgi:hypothetical protein
VWCWRHFKVGQEDYGRT